jgi:Spy/CpxP family protein refolding chaperone
MNKQMDSKILRAAAVLLCAGGLMASSAMAQQPQDAPPPPPDGQMQGPPPGGHEGRNPERRLEMLQKHLNLSDDQAAQVKSVWEGERAKAEALRANTSLAPQDRRAQIMAVHEDGEAKIHAILTPDQKTKYDELEARMREHRHGRPEGPPPADGSAPPPAPPAPQQ